jgi:hypothetical protein
VTGASARHYRTLAKRRSLRVVRRGSPRGWASSRGATASTSRTRAADPRDLDHFGRHPGRWNGGRNTQIRIGDRAQVSGFGWRAEEWAGAGARRALSNWERPQAARRARIRIAQLAEGGVSLSSTSSFGFHHYLMHGFIAGCRPVSYLWRGAISITFAKQFSTGGSASGIKDVNHDSLFPFFHNQPTVAQGPTTARFRIGRKK